MKRLILILAILTATVALLNAETISVSGTAIVIDNGTFTAYQIDTNADGVADYRLGFGPLWYTPDNGLTRPAAGDAISVTGTLNTNFTPALIFVYELNGETWRTPIAVAVDPADDNTTDTTFWTEISGTVTVNTALAFDRYYLDTDGDNMADYLLNFGPASFVAVSGASRPVSGDAVTVYGLINTAFTPDMMFVYTLNGDAWRVLPGSQVTIGDYLGTLPVEDVSDAEVAGLVHMREEEKLARDVYTAFYAQYGTKVFDNISRSEDYHMSLVGTLLEKYGITDPALAEAGQFSNESLQALYNQLVAAGMVSLTDALTVGATIEDLDIYDLEEELQLADNADIRVVYQNLMKGSRNHMRAFYRLLGSYDLVYAAQYISEEELQAIIASDRERGPVDGDGNPLDLRSVTTSDPDGDLPDGYAAVDNVLAKDFHLKSFPNPFNPITTISYELADNTKITLRVFDIQGRYITTLESGVQSEGIHSIQWDGRNERGSLVASGVYVVSLTSPEITQYYRVLYLK